MLYFKEVMADLDKEIKKLRLEASSSRFPTTDDHSYIVGLIDGVIRSKEMITTVLNKLEILNDFDPDEDEDREFGSETRKNIRGRISEY